MDKIKLKTILGLFFFLTPLRMAVVPFMPFALRLRKNFFRGTIPLKTFWLIVFYVVATVLGCINGTNDWANGFVGLWISVPLFFLQFINVTNVISKEYFNKLLVCYKYFLALIDILGAFFYFVVFKGGDEFGYAYGVHFQYVSGLAMMNAVMILYYALYILESKERIPKNTYLWLLFFIISFVFCFFGLGLLCLALAFGFYFCSKVSLKKIIYGIIAISVFVVLLFKSGTEIIEYNNRNIELAVDAIRNPRLYAYDARKVLMFSNYIDMIEDEPLLFLTGTGAGGFNSRVSFLLNRDSNNEFTKIFGHHMPYYHSKNIYPLWNNKIVSFDERTDGTRNKPFSSLLAILAEGGIVVFFLYISLWIRVLIFFFRKGKENYIYNFLFVFNIFWLLSMASEVWFESSEFLFFLIVNSICVSYCNSLKNRKNNDTKNYTLLLVGK